MVDYAPREFLVDYFMNEKLEEQLFDITFGCEEWKKLDAGLITRQEAEAAMRRRGAELGHSFEVDVYKRQSHRYKWAPAARAES